MYTKLRKQQMCPICVLENPKLYQKDMNNQERFQKAKRRESRMILDFWKSEIKEELNFEWRIRGAENPE